MALYTRCSIGKWIAVWAVLSVWMPFSADAGEVLPKATPFSMDVYGYIPGAGPGDQISVFDPDGVLCGFFAVDTPGRYGFLHVYGDDPATADDEGARIGDRLTFQLNGIPLNGPNVFWLGDRRRRQVDFQLN